MGAKRETRLVNRMRKAIEQSYPEAMAVKIHGSPYQRAGLPDLVVILRGRVAGLEVKAAAPGESEEHARQRVTALQQATLDEMARAGAVTAVVVSVEEAVRVVRALLGDADPES